MIKSLLNGWYSHQLSLRRIDKYCNSLEMKRNPVGRMDNKETFRVGCIQRQIRLCSNIEEYIQMIYSFVSQAVEDECSLVVFPEYNFFDLFGLIPGFGIIDKYLNRKSNPSTDRENEKYNNENNYSLIKQIFQGIARPVEKALKKIMSRLARGFGIYIYSGSYLLQEGSNLFNAGSLFGPDGNCLLTQKKLHLTDFEEEIGMNRGTEMEIYSFPFSKAVFPICMDATYFETFQIADKMGAELVILPIANMEEYNTWRAKRGIWNRVQESYVYGLKAALNGWVGGMHFTGKAGIFAPLEMNPGKAGIISIAPYPEGDYVISTDLNFSDLRKIKKEVEYYGDENFEFEENYARKIYQGLVNNDR